MKGYLMLTVACAIVVSFGFQSASAQFPIEIPKIKIGKPKTEQPQSQRGGNAAYDKEAFNSIKWGNSQYITPYLECYSKKHNLELYSVTGDAFSPLRITDPKEVKKYLEAEFPKLAEVEGLLKSKLPSRPNTGKNYHENPAIWEEITTKRVEYLQCVIDEKTSTQAPSSPWLNAHLEMIQRMQKELDAYNPATDIHPVSATNTDYLLIAVSPRERAKWISGDTLEFKPNLDPVLDALAASAAKKLPFYKPAAAWFKFRNPTAEKLLMNIFKNPATIKVYSIGLGSAGWDIQKDNYGLLPSYRYKYANVYYRDSSDDHPYCRLASTTIKQDYAGGGTYNTQTYRSSATFGLIGCPAGAE